MAEKYKSVLEKHNENRTHCVPTAEEEAIEPVYPEEYLVGGPGKAAASGLRSKAEKTVANAASRYRIAQTRIGERAQDINEVKEQLKNRAALKNRPMYKEVFGDDEAKQARQKLAKEFLNKAESSAERGWRDFHGEVGNTLGNRIYQQREQQEQEDMQSKFGARQNAAGDTYKKGGKVKSTASSRGDGIASRGKTRGKLV
jgi:hypothetical protein